MPRRSDRRPPAAPDPLLEQIVGFGERSMRKSYYPEAQRHLRALQRFRTMLDSGNDLILLVALPAATIIDANLPLCRRLGWTREALLGQPFAAVAPGGEIEGLLAECGGGRAGTQETTFTARDGDLFPVELTCRVSTNEAPDAAGADRTALLVARDITESRFLECQLRTEKDRAERANLAKSKFLAAASHDLRQPAQSLTLFTTLLGSKLQGHPAAGLVGHLRESVDALRLLLDGLLDVSRLDAGLVVPAVRPFAAEAVLGPLRGEYQLRAAEKGLRLRIVPGRQWLVSDPLLLETVLRNLLENAIRYTRQGGIVVGCRRRGAQVEIQVWDSGIGLAPDQLDSIFEEFYQVGNPERDRSQGLGLGLAIVRRLAHLLGHRIAVRSHPGRGSCFSLSLDAADAKPAAPPPPRLAHSGPPCCNGLSLLVVDDDLVVRESLTMLLESWGCRVTAAAGSQEAVARVREGRADCRFIVADYRLRDETGPQAIAAVSQALGHPVSGLILTGDTAPERIAEAAAHGFAVLHKPVSAENLLAALCVWIKAASCGTGCG
jgi:PAS domain S-box-containing protein